MRNMIQERSKNVKCGFCQGRGKVALNAGVRTCTSCQGNGKIIVPLSHKKCKKCNGTGKIGWRQCSICGAKGWS